MRCCAAHLFNLTHPRQRELSQAARRSRDLEQRTQVRRADSNTGGQRRNTTPCRPSSAPPQNAKSRHLNPFNLCELRCLRRCHPVCSHRSATRTQLRGTTGSAKGCSGADAPSPASLQPCSVAAAPSRAEILPQAPVPSTPLLWHQNLPPGAFASWDALFPGRPRPCLPRRYPAAVLASGDAGRWTGGAWLWAALGKIMQGMPFLYRRLLD